MFAHKITRHHRTELENKNKQHKRTKQKLKTEIKAICWSEVWTSRVMWGTGDGEADCILRILRARAANQTSGYVAVNHGFSSCAECKMEDKNIYKQNKKTQTSVKIRFFLFYYSSSLSVHLPSKWQQTYF